MDRKTFFIYNLFGGFVWAAGLTYIGYAAGRVIEKYGINIEYVTLGIILISVLPPALHIFKEKENRDTLRNAIVSYFHHLRGK